MQKNYIYRGGFYLVGLLVLALGISLNTKTGLGVSPTFRVLQHNIRNLKLGLKWHIMVSLFW